MTAKQVKDFMLWLRKERIGYTSISLGGVVIDGVIDGKLARPAEKHEEPKSAWQRYGGDLLKQPVTTIDDVPDEAKVD